MQTTVKTIKGVVRIGGGLTPVPNLLGVRVECCQDDFFNSFERDQELDLLVLHETAGHTREGCELTLAEKRLGVHFIVDLDGLIVQYVDTAMWCSHAMGVNKRSVGIEVVNIYNASRDQHHKHATLSGHNLPWWYGATSEERWGQARKAYTIPTAEQMCALLGFVPWLCCVTNVPYEFPMWGSRMVRSAPPPGIVSHRSQNDNRADGQYLLDALYNDKRTDEC